MLFRCGGLVAAGALLGLVISGCGRPDGLTDDGGDPDRQNPKPNGQLANDYFVQDETCQQSGGATTVENGRVRTWAGGKTRSRLYSFQESGSSTALAGPPVRMSYFDYHQKSQCEQGSSGLECSGDTEVLSQPRPLKVCQSKAEYERHSMEGVGLTGLAHLQTAAEYYESVEGSENLDEAALLVLPMVERIYTKNTANGEQARFRKIETDNLAYAPSFGGTPVFVIFPKSRQAVEKGYWENVNLWEIPWALAHEFGHHVFRSHTGVSGFSEETGPTALQKESWLPIHSFDPKDPRAEKHSEFGLQAAEASAEQHWNAINEGFADLFAYYALGEKENLVTGVDCFEKNRNPAKDRFATGRRKVLDSEVLLTFQNQSPSAGSGCRAPRFRSIHTVGAVVAYGADQVLDAHVEGGSAAARRTEKARLLLQWSERLETFAESTDPSRIRLETLLGQFAAALLEDGSRLDDKACEALDMYFPAFRAVWEDSAYGCG